MNVICREGGIGRFVANKSACLQSHLELFLQNCIVCLMLTKVLKKTMNKMENLSSSGAVPMHKNVKKIHFISLYAYERHTDVNNKALHTPASPGLAGKLWFGNYMFFSA